MPSDITLAELEADLLPERQTLWGFSFLSPVVIADPTAVALAFGSHAYAYADATTTIMQMVG